MKPQDRLPQQGTFDTPQFLKKRAAAPPAAPTGTPLLQPVKRAALPRPQIEQAVADPNDSQSLGAVLQRARTARDVSTKEVAARLNLSSHLIEALERDEFDEVGAPIYVRSYLARYADLVGVAKEPLLQRFKELGLEKPPPLRVTHSGGKSTSAGSGMRWLTYPLLALAVLWVGWLGYDQVAPYVAKFTTGASDPAAIREQYTVLLPGQTQTPTAATDPATGAGATPSAETATTTAADTSATSSTTIASSNTVKLPPPTPAGSNLPPGLSLKPPQEAATAVNNGYVDTPLAAEKLQTQASTAGVTVPATSPQQLVEQSLALKVPAADGSVAAALPEASADPAASRSQASLSLAASEDCWIEIKDADGQRLAYGTVKAGSRNSFAGKAPLTVILGNSTVVELSLNGKPVDKATYVRPGGVSRFVLASPVSG